MRAPHLDILKKQQDGGFVWIEATTDVQLAEERIAELAEKEQGEYFIFDQKTQQIVAKVAKQGEAEERLDASNRPGPSASATR